jgi:hypothetical protein
VSLVTDLAFLGAGLFLWLTKRKPHQRCPAYLKKERAKLRAKVRRELRSHRGKKQRGYRRGIRKLLSGRRVR